MIRIEKVSKKYISRKRRLRLFQKDFEVKTENEDESTESVTVFKKGLLLKRKIKHIHALNEIELNIKRGEIFGLLGPNGAGKTTLTKIISTLVLPDRGEIFVNGASTLTNPTPVRNSLGLVTGGERSLYWKMTPMENLVFFGRLYHLSRKEAERRALKLIESFNLKDKKDELVQNLSTGQKMKVAFCRALVHDPPILLVDEAERGLDPRASKEFRTFLKEELQQKQGKTILLCTHNMEILDELCDRIALINKGRIIALDTPEKLKLNLKQKHILSLQSRKAIPEALLKEIPNVGDINSKCENEFHFTKIVIENSTTVANTVLQAIYNSNIEIDEFSLKAATLEDVFLKLTGRKLEDEADGLD